MNSMKCPECDFDCPDNAVECPACGLIFDRWKEHAESIPAPEHIPIDDEPADEDEIPNAVDVPTPEPEPEPEPVVVEEPVASKSVRAKKPFNPLWALIGLLVVLLGIGFYWWFNASPAKPSTNIVIAVPPAQVKALASATPITSGIPAASPTVVAVAQVATPTSVPEPPAKPTAVPKQVAAPVAKKPAPATVAKPAATTPKPAPTVTKADEGAIISDEPAESGALID